MFEKSSFDSKRREEIEREITQAMRRLAGGQGFEFQIAPGEEGIMALIIEGIMQKNPHYSLVAWKNGPAIVRRRDVDAIKDKSIRDVNVDAGFITAGGDSFNIEDISPTPTGADSIRAEEYHREMPNAAELYNIPELAPKGK